MKAATGINSAPAPVALISIHAAREGGDIFFVRQHLPHRISIHAAREGGDARLGLEYYCLEISIHAAREGGDDMYDD